MADSLGEWIDFRAVAHPYRTALHYEGRSFSYGELGALSRKAARFLRRSGIRHGDRFAVLDFNTPPALLLWLGACRLGAVPVYANWRFTSGELAYILKDAGVRALFYGEDFSKAVNGIDRPELPLYKIDQLPEMMESDNSDELEEERIDREEVLIQLYTSGTTGYPRGVLITHRSMISMIRGISTELPGLGPDSVNMIAGPLFNIAGAGYFALGLYNGATGVLVRKFDPGTVAKAMVDHGVTNVFLAPAMIQAILQIPGLEEYNFSSLRNIHYGGSPVQLSLLKRARSVFGCDFTQGYGLTETTGITTLLRFDDHRRAFHSDGDDGAEILGSAGRPVAGMEIRIVDSEGADVAHGEPGEVVIRGINLSAGYWNNHAPFLDSGGWFHSGDIGQMDSAGYLHIVDRKNDMIISGGINIYPAEIERVLMLHPDVEQAAVIGIPDEKFGERIMGFIVAPGKTIGLEDMQTWCRDQIAGYKIPSQIIQTAQLPMNPTGKVLRRQLREPYWKDRERKI